LVFALSILADATARIVAAHAQINATAVVTDSVRGVIRFMIEGKEVARIDENGLHVANNIEYGGSITDTGADVPVKPSSGDAP